MEQAHQQEERHPVVQLLLVQQTSSTDDPRALCSTGNVVERDGGPHKVVPEMAVPVIQDLLSRRNHLQVPLMLASREEKGRGFQVGNRISGKGTLAKDSK